ncbi:MAG: hypothetical protein AB7T06_10925 [Kofleriaceae bacterium]
MPSPRNCVVHVDRAGITADGARVDLAEAMKRCTDAGQVVLTAHPDAPASTCATMMSALGNAGIPVATPRNARAPSRSTTSDTFTVAIYPQGIHGAGKRVRWFLAEGPTTWEAARDRLVAARILDPRAIGPSMPGYWRLVTDTRAFDRGRAEPLPGTPPRGSARGPRFTHEGRRILRDGEAILYLDRVDLGNQRFALSPHEADLMTDRIVRLLNRKGGR